MNFDILIIGAGPAGTAAALTCLHAGLSVCVISKPMKESVNPIRPLQSIHPGVLSLLNQLGLEGIINHSSKATFNGIAVNGEFNRLSTNNEEWYGHHIDRYLFDEYLLKALKGNRIKVIEEENFKLDLEESSNLVCINWGEGNQFRANYLIDASGYQRKTKRFLDLKEYVLTAPLHCWTGVSETTPETGNEVMQTSFIPQQNGWVWVAPESKNRFTWTKLVVNKKEAFSSPFPNTKTISKIATHNVRWRVFRPVCKQKILLCGDAAGILDPAAGQGILNAFMSGIMVANCVKACVVQPHLEAYHFMQYDQWFIGQFEEKVIALKKYYKELNIEINIEKTSKEIELRNVDEINH